MSFKSFFENLLKQEKGGVLQFITTDGIIVKDPKVSNWTNDLVFIVGLDKDLEFFTKNEDGCDVLINKKKQDLLSKIEFKKQKEDGYELLSIDEAKAKGVIQEDDNYFIVKDCTIYYEIDPNADASNEGKVMFLPMRIYKIEKEVA